MVGESADIREVCERCLGGSIDLLASVFLYAGEARSWLLRRGKAGMTDSRQGAVPISVEEYKNMNNFVDR